MDRIEELEKLLEQRTAEIDHWKAHARKWESRSKKNFAALKRLERELIQQKNTAPARKTNQYPTSPTAQLRRHNAEI